MSAGEAVLPIISAAKMAHSSHFRHADAGNAPRGGGGESVKPESLRRMAAAGNPIHLSLRASLANCQTRSKITAMPWPTPMHMETSA